MIKKLGSSLARHWHGMVIQMNGYTRVGIALFDEAPRWVVVFH